MSDLHLWTFFVFDHIRQLWTIFFSVRLTINMSTLEIARRVPFSIVLMRRADLTLSARPFLTPKHRFRLQVPSTGRISRLQPATINLSTFVFCPAEPN